jgi:TonB family protein
MPTANKPTTLFLLTLALFGATTPALAGPPKASVEGSLDKAAIREVVRAHIDEVRLCYDAELVEDEDLAGQIVVGFVIATDGHVRTVEMTSSNMPPRFDACVAAAVERWTFPSAASETTVSYPFLLEPG